MLTSWGERSLARGRDTEILGCIETVLGRHPDVDWTADVVELESRETVLGLRGIVREIEHDLNLQQCGMD
ncbi:MAG: hypothetical protein A49_03660 [Methyloceanibacter sp.]|nr:MAG: hypothetical protein A49_03660 [Methyloceanibacter sp.]